MSRSASGPAGSPWLIWYTGSVMAAGIWAMATSLGELAATPQPLGWLTLAALALVASRFSVKLPGVAANLSIADTFFLASVLLYGPAPATVAIALDSWLMSRRRRHGLHQLLFNPTSNAVALWSGAQVYYGLAPLLASLGFGPLAPSLTLLPLLALGGVYFVLNSGLTCVAAALATRQPILPLWRMHFASIWVNHLAAASAAFALHLLIREGGVLGGIVVIPLLYVFYAAMRSDVVRLEDAQRHIARVDSLYTSMVSAFATAIEAKDGVTSNHIHRVRAYAMEVARRLGITDEPTLHAIAAASLLHDTGKLAVPEHILNKPGKLTEHEFEVMKLHVEVGAGILSSIDFPYPVVPIVAAHHENWDGSGYPKGLRGEDIPLGARILSVVDCYDALTSDRPYRRALSDPDAIAIVTTRRGTMYDPQVVDAFLSIERHLTLPEAARPELQEALRRIAESVHLSPSIAPAPALPSAARAAALSLDGRFGAEPAQAMSAVLHIASEPAGPGEIADLAGAVLRTVVPDGLIVLYLADHVRGTLQSAWASGPGSSAAADLTMPLGERLSGWAAVNRSVMANAQAELDCVELKAWNLQLATSLPLVTGDDTVGVLTCYTSTPLVGDQVQQLAQMAPQMSEALQRSTMAEAERSRLSAHGKRGSELRVKFASGMESPERGTEAIPA